jgi:hypothetical protein
MKQRNNENIQGEQTMKEIFARISLQLATIHNLLQEMRSSRRRVITSPEAALPVAVGAGQGSAVCPERNTPSHWLVAAGDVERSRVTFI